MILIDCDGVISDFRQGFLVTYIKCGGRVPENMDYSKFDFIAQLPDRDAVKMAWNNAALFGPALPVIESAAQCIRERIALGDDFAILTSCPPQHVTTRIEWFTKLISIGVEWWKKIIFCPADLKRHVKGDVLIEDSYENLAQWCDENPRSLGVLVTQPWNALARIRRHNMVRASSLAAYFHPMDHIEYPPCDDQELPLG